MTGIRTEGLRALTSGEYVWTEESGLGNAATVTTSSGTQTVNEALDQRAVLSPSELIEFRVPSDFPNLQSAVDFIARKHPVNRGAVDILIESGYEVTSGLLVSRCYAGNINITAEDSVVFCNLPNDQDCILVQNDSHGPRIRALFDLQGTGNHGLSVQGNSRGRISEGTDQNDPSAAIYGFINARVRNVDCGLNCSVLAENTILSGAGERNISTRSTGYINARGSDLRNAGQYSVHCERKGNINASQSWTSGAGVKDVRVLWGGEVAMNDATTSNSAESGIPNEADFTIRANTVTPDGIIYSNLQSQGSIENISGDVLPIAGSESIVLITRSAPRILVGGHIAGVALRVTVTVAEHEVYKTSTAARGENSGGDGYTPLSIPTVAAGSEGPISVTVTNVSSNASVFGYSLAFR